MTLVITVAAGPALARNLAEPLPWRTPSAPEATQDVGLPPSLCAQDSAGCAIYLNANPPKCPAKKGIQFPLYSQED